MYKIAKLSIALCLLFYSCKKEPSPAFDVEILNCESPYQLHFVNQSQNYDWFEWVIDGNTYTMENPIVELEDSRPHSLQLQLKNGKKNRIHNQSFFVSDFYFLPEGSFSYSFPDCMNHRKTSFSAEVSGEYHSVCWDFGDGTKGHGLNTSYEFTEDGLYRVRCGIIKCQDTVYIHQNVLISEEQVQPNANFSWYKGGNNPSGAIFLGNYVKFNNSSEYGSSYLWDFGDGNTSTSFEPKHTFESTGTFMVTLITSCGERSDSRQKEITVKSPSGVRFAQADVSGISDSWDSEEFNDTTEQDQFPPDVYIVIQKGSCVIFTSSVKENLTSGSASWSVGEDVSNLSGTYSVTVYDEDESGSEEIGSFEFQPSTLFSFGNYPSGVSGGNSQVDIQLSLDWY